jgi:hypothetical protein
MLVMLPRHDCDLALSLVCSRTRAIPFRLLPARSLTV